MLSLPFICMKVRVPTVVPGTTYKLLFSILSNNRALDSIAV